MRTPYAALVEAVLVCLLLGRACTDDAGARARASVPAPKPRVLPEASPFSCLGDECRQLHVRLPDDGEWRCAERDGTVWCTGGEPAAGVVAGKGLHGYRCGPRRGTLSERVCVDAKPDYPDGGKSAYRCRFESDFGVTRVCRRDAMVVRALPAGRAPECWLDRDCAGTACDRGFCVGVAP